MVQSIDDVRLPLVFERRAQGTRAFKTRVFEADNGYEPTRRAVLSAPRRTWVIQSIPVKMSAIAASDLETVIKMFEAAKGQVYGFKLRTKYDYSVSTVAEGAVGTGDGSTLTFQLRKAYTTSAHSNYRPIWCPDATSTPIVKINGVTKTVTTDYAISTAGLLTMVVAPPNGHSVDVYNYDFDTPVRFDMEELEDELDADDDTLTLPTVRLRELLLA